MNKQAFLYYEVGILAWGASVQRAGLYKKDHNPAEVKKFRNAILAYMEQELFPKYEQVVNEAEHLVNIAALSTRGTELGKNVLSTNGYKIGVAQKLLNLYLKYLWCMDKVPMPPHCPVDRRILATANSKAGINWTQIVTLDRYIEAIAEIKAASRDTPLSEWELSNFTRQ